MPGRKVDVGGEQILEEEKKKRKMAFTRYASLRKEEKYRQNIVNLTIRLTSDAFV